MINKIKQALQQGIKQFVDDKRGIVALWGMVFLGMAVYVIIWFSVGLPLVYFIDATRELLVQHMDSTGIAVVSSLLFAFEIHPVIAICGWIIYGIMHSGKRATNVYQEA